MRKLLTIMLALLVIGGVAFADDVGTLTLTSKVAGVLKHGFIAAQITNANFGKINTGLSGVGLDYTYTSDINLESNDVTEVGYYYFLANTANPGYTVEFVVNPFSSATADFEVPLTLTVAKDVNVNVNVTAGNISTGGEIGTDIIPSLSTIVMDTVNALVGPKYAGVKLMVSTNGTANAAYGIPAANDYVATVVASVTTK